MSSDDRLRKYYEMVVERNKVMNLTAITDEEEFRIKHFEDSASITESGVFTGKGSLIDVGTGAGFPGMVLKILYPELKVTLADSLRKRIDFLNEVNEELGLDCETVHGRAEDLGRDPRYREKFDYAAARAVANMSTLSEYCLPFVKKGGYFIAYKTPGEALCEKAVETLGGRIEAVKEFRLPGTDIERALIVVKKVRETPRIYPRKAGTPSKEPL